MKIQDTVRAVVDEVRFTRVVNMMREAKNARMNTVDVPGIVKLVSKDFHITDDESSGVLQRLIEGNDGRHWLQHSFHAGAAVEPN